MKIARCAATIAILLVVVSAGAADAFKHGALPEWPSSSSGPLRPHSLPAGYRLLEYVESTGAQYVDTELGYFSDFEIGVVLRQSVGNITLGTDNNNRLERISAANPKWQLSVNGSSRTTSLSITTKADISYREGVLSGNGATIGTLQNSFSSGRMVLFSIGSRVPTAYPAIVFYLRCYDSSGVLVRDYIPVADTNGVAGLWDRVSGTMAYSATATPLVAGPELRLETLPALSAARRNWYERALLATNPPPPAVSGVIVRDGLAIPEGLKATLRSRDEIFVAERPVLEALVGRYRNGLAPTNLPVYMEHDRSRPAGRVTDVWRVPGEGVWVRMLLDGETVQGASRRISPELKCVHATATDPFGDITVTIPWCLTGVGIVADPGLDGTFFVPTKELPYPTRPKRRQATP